MAILEMNAWSIAFRACLEPLAAKAIGRGWHLVIRSDQGTVTAKSAVTEIVVRLPRGFTAISPLWVAQRIAEQLRQQAIEAGAFAATGSPLVAGLALKKPVPHPEAN